MRKCFVDLGYTWGGSALLRYAEEVERICLLRKMSSGGLSICVHQVLAVVPILFLSISILGLCAKTDESASCVQEHGPNLFNINPSIMPIPRSTTSETLHHV